MVLIAPTMRMGHSEGHTDVCYDETGKIILTCGSDGDVRVWQGLDDDDPQSIDVGESSAALTLHKRRLFIASDTNTVQAYTFPEGQSDGIITRFTAPVSHLALSEDGQKLVAGASDFNIKVVDQQDSSQKVFEGHTAPILSVSIDPQKQYIASSSCDGTLKIWDLSQEKLEKSSMLIPKCSDVSLSKTLCRMSWKPGNGKFLAVPLEKKVEVYERGSWEVACSLEPAGAGGFVSVVAWSPCGNFLASANTDGTLCFWDVKDRKCVEQTKHKKGLSICGLAWNPTTKHEIAFTDIMGQVGVFEGVVPSGTSSGTSNGVAQNQEVDEDLVADLFDDAADEDLLAAVTQAETGDKDELDALVNEDDDDDDPIQADIRKAKQRLAMLTGEGQSIDGVSNAGDTASLSGSVSGSTDVVPPVLSAPVSTPVTPMQKPFTPSSTPVHLSSRFMKWNSVGIIRCYDTDDESTIDVEFHDTAVHHALHFDNQHNYTMADLSADAVLLAAESNLESPSLLMCHHFSSWDIQKEWSTFMPKGENIKCVAIGGGWVATATDKHLVRMYSISGTQWEIFSLTGPVVCLAAHRHQIMVVYHAGVGVPGDQCLGVKLLDVGRKKECLVLDGRLPLSPKSTLAWLGFTAEGTAASVDSEGVLRLHSRKLQSWTPVANTKSHTKARSDNYWVVGIHENQQQLRCVQCRGAAFPPTLPRPTISILPLQLPLCELTTEKGQMEETYWRSRLLCQHSQQQGHEEDGLAKARMERVQEDNLMKLFALACRSDCEFRAHDICGLMTSHQTVRLAIKYASRSRRIALAERLSELASRLLQEEEEEEEEEEEIMDVHHRRRLQANGHYGSRGNKAGIQADEQDAAGDEEQEEDVDVDMEEEEEEEQPEEKVPVLTLTHKPAKVPSLLPSSQGKRNPFKKLQGKSSTPTLRGTGAFDEMKKKSPDKSHQRKNGKESITKQPSGTKNKLKTQATLFAPKAKSSDDSTEKKEASSQGTITKKAPSAFNFWLSQNRDSLSEENSELGASEIVKLAMQTWKGFSDDEKQEWGEKAILSVGETASKKDATSQNKPGEKKRKRPNDDAGSDKQSAETNRSKKVLRDTKKQPLNVATNTKLASFAFSKD